MDQKKFQMYVNPETDPKLYGFIERIESEAPGKKGYVVDQIKAILRAWSGLVDIYGETDTLALAMQLASGKPIEHKQANVEVQQQPVVNLPKGLGVGLVRNRTVRGE